MNWFVGASSANSSLNIFSLTVSNITSLGSTLWSLIRLVSPRLSVVEGDGKGRAPVLSQARVKILVSLSYENTEGFKVGSFPIWSINWPGVNLYSKL